MDIGQAATAATSLAGALSALVYLVVTCGQYIHHGWRWLMGEVEELEEEIDA